MATYAWMLDKKGTMYPVGYHYYVYDSKEEAFDSAIEAAKFISEVSNDEKVYGTSYDMINYSIALDIYDNAVEDEDMTNAIKELYNERLESNEIDEELAIKAYNEYMPYSADNIEEFIDFTDESEMANNVKEALNNNFIRMRLGGMIDSDNVAGGEMVYRISSNYYNWADVIYQNVYDNKNKYKIKSVTICRDSESDFGFGSGQTKFYKNKRGEEYNQVPVNEFLSGEFDSNPYFEKKKKNSKSKILKEVNLDMFDVNYFGEDWEAHVDKENIKGATLLTLKDYEKYADKIPEIKKAWWTQEPGENWNTAFIIDCSFSDHPYFEWLISREAGVRPALIIEVENQNIGEKLNFNNHMFTILSNNLAICDDIITKSCFNFLPEWDKIENNVDYNDYETSILKEFVDNWFNNAIKNYEG